MARFRLGNEVNEAKYCEKDEKKKCRLCGREEETWEHVWERCANREKEKGGWQDKCKELLGEEGKGEY